MISELSTIYGLYFPFGRPATGAVKGTILAVHGHGSYLMNEYLNYQVLFLSTTVSVELSKTCHMFDMATLGDSGKGLRYAVCTIYTCFHLCLCFFLAAEISGQDF